MRPYESPGKRQRRMRAMHGMAGDEPAGASADVSTETPEPPPDNNPEAGAPAPESEGGEKTEGFTAFLPKEITQGKTFKAGDEIVLSVKAVDPDTGELEVEYASDEGDGPMAKMEEMPDDGEQKG